VKHFGPQRGPQADLLSCPANEVMYGGARGGGKTHGVCLDWYAHQEKNGAHASGIIFRRTYPELENVIETSREIFAPLGANYVTNEWRFPNGSNLKLRHLDKDKDADKYQGHQYTFAGFDEAGNWPNPGPIDKLRACLRNTYGIKPRMVLTSNPGGPGHNWLKRRFVDPAAPLSIQYIEQLDADGEPIDPWTRVFIPSRVEDNKILTKSQPGYVAQIRDSGPKWLVDAWLKGNWNIVAGGAIDDLWEPDEDGTPKHVVRPFAIPAGWRIDRSYDWGSSSPFSVIWWAEADGETFTDGDGYEAWVPKGTVFAIAEWYGANDKAEGLLMTDAEVAKGILQRELLLGFKGRVKPGPADNQIFSVIGGYCIADEMSANGVHWEHSNKGSGSRINGLQILRDRLSASLSFPMEKPGLFIFDTCVSWISHVPMVQRDPMNIEDVDTKCEDHEYDASRYRLNRQKGEVTSNLIAGMH